MVRLAARRHDQVRREPAEEVRGHRQLPLLPRGDPRHLVRDARDVPALVRARREAVPRRQPAHQAVPVLGVGDRRGAGAAPGRDLPRRGLHPAEGDEAARQGRLLAVLLLLHLAQREGRDHRLPDRADARRVPRVHAAELLRQHARHQPGLPADERPAGLPDPAGARGDARAATTASTTASRSARRRRSRARRSTCTRRSTRSGPGTSTGPGTSRTTSGSSTGCAATTRRCRTS